MLSYDKTLRTLIVLQNKGSMQCMTSIKGKSSRQNQSYREHMTIENALHDNTKEEAEAEETFLLETLTDGLFCFSAVKTYFQSTAEILCDHLLCSV